MLVPFRGPVEACEQLFCVRREGCVACAPPCVVRFSAAEGFSQTAKTLVLTKLSDRHMTIVPRSYLSLFENFTKKRKMFSMTQCEKRPAPERGWADGEPPRDLRVRVAPAELGARALQAGRGH